MAKGKIKPRRVKPRPKEVKRDDWSPEPGEASAGELAAELFRRLAFDSEAAITDLLRCREPLSPTAKVAFDMARWGSCELFGIATDLPSAANRSGNDRSARDAWLLLASYYGWPDSVAPLVVERAKQNPADPHLGVACRLMARLHRTPVLSLLDQLSTLLPDELVLEIRRALPLPGVSSDDEARDVFLHALEPFESALAPHFSLFALVKGEPPATLEDPPPSLHN